MDGQLATNFSLNELCITNHDLDNTPAPAQVENLKRLCVELLQPIRDKWGPLRVTSGFRSSELEKKLNWKAYQTWCDKRNLPVDDGSWTMYLSGKQHPKGEAADFIPLEADINEVYHWIVRGSGLRFGQCILEKVDWKMWIHLSLPRQGKVNQAALVYNGKEYLPYGA